jgi:hypothetical protein
VAMSLHVTVAGFSVSHLASYGVKRILDKNPAAMLCDRIDWKGVTNRHQVLGRDAEGPVAPNPIPVGTMLARIHFVSSQLM